MGAKEEGYGMMPRVEESFASHLSPDIASSLWAPALPTKPCRTTLALVGKAYMAAGRAGSCLHTMGLLQAYQADLLKEVDDSGEVAFDNIREMLRVVGLSLRATKETAPAIGRSMVALVATERHLWLNLSGIGDKDRACLLDAPVSPSGLFGDGVNNVVDRFQEAKRQSAAFKELIPRRRSRSRGSAARGQSHEAAASSSHLRQRESVASRAPPESEAQVMEDEVQTLFAKEAIEYVPLHQRDSGFYSRYFIVPKDGGLRPIIDLRMSSSLNTRPHTKNWTEIRIDSDVNVNSLKRALTELKKTLDKTLNEKLSQTGLKFVQKFAVDVTLDPKTVNPRLILSDDGKQVSRGDVQQDIPENPKRFDAICVLAKQGFSSGRFYYEVQVKGKTQWDLGVARESINRKGKIRLRPVDGVWTVVLRTENQYFAGERSPVCLSLRVKPEKVGVFVDYEEGLVSFYDVESRSHIYSFTGQTFTDKLYPYFSPCDNDEVMASSADHRTHNTVPIEEESQEKKAFPAVQRKWQGDVTSPFPTQGTRVTYVTETFPFVVTTSYISDDEWGPQSNHATSGVGGGDLEYTYDPEGLHMENHWGIQPQVEYFNPRGGKVACRGKDTCSRRLTVEIHMWGSPRGGTMHMEAPNQARKLPVA
ncbi:unnamed protein product [Leuciscus chuanchicus]